MKKIIYSSLILGSAFALASCSADEPGIAKNEGPLTLTVQLPAELATRFADGKSVDILYYSILDETGTNVLDFGSQEWTKGSQSATVTLDLVPSQNYQVVFFAMNSAAATEDKANAYDYDAKTATFTVNYDNVAVNDDIFDAFCAKVSGINTGYDTTENPIALSRPFAQINIGTNDLGSAMVAAYGLENYTTTFTVEKTNLATAYNFTTGEYTSAEQGISKVVEGLEATSELTDAYPVEGYKYLDMMYLLVNPGADADAQALLSATFTTSINNGATEVQAVNLSSLPAKANYQTNVYGKLLTSSKDFTVQITPAFAGTLETVSKWDGSVTTPTVDDVARTVTLNQASDFAGLAQLINEGNNFAGYTVKLNNDFDMQGKEVPAIAGAAARKSGALVDTSKAFQGVFDGQNHTISNAVITGSGTASNAASVFGAISGSGAAIKNINFDNLTINNTLCEQTGVVGLVADGATVSNVHVLSGSVTGTQGVGAIVGRVLADGNVTGCTNAATVNANSTNVGGIVGAAYYTAEGKEMNITNCNNTGNVTSESAVCGGIVGLSAANVTGCTNTGKVSTKGYSTGGIIGEQQNYGTVSGCTNEGEVTNNSATYGTGGIIGWIRYSGAAAAYPQKEIITVSDCHNTANISAITGSSGVGGIVGVIFYWGNVKNCTNTATSLSGGQWVSGIVGAQQNNTSNPAHEGMTTEEYGPYLVTLTGNSTTTTLDQMTGDRKSLLIYVNNGNSAVKLEGNTPSSNN